MTQTEKYMYCLSSIQTREAAKKDCLTQKVIVEVCGGVESCLEQRLISTAAMLTDGLKEPYFTP